MAKFLRELAYIGIGVSSLPNWQSFATDVLGIEVVDGFTPGTALLRLDEMEYRFILIEDGTDDVSFVGWDAYDEKTLEAYARYLEEIGIDYVWASAADLELRGIDRMLYMFDPNGVRHEAFIGLRHGTKAFTSPKITSGYITSPGGLGHVVFGSDKISDSIDFARRVLGAGASDTIREEIMPSRVLTVTFFHINERHHSIAFADQAGPKKLHHFMLEVGGIADVGKTRDRHIKTGLPIAQDIGQHPNDKIISYYGVVPSGFLMEFGWGGVQVDAATWQEGSYDRLSEWGHKPRISG